MICGADTLRRLASTPRLLASDEESMLELSEPAEAAAASEASPTMVIVIVMLVDCTIGDATLTLWPRADAREPVKALVSCADSVALELRLLPESIGIEISKVISVVLCSRRPSSSPPKRRPLRIVTVQPTGWPAQTLLDTEVRWAWGSAPDGKLRPRTDFFSRTT